MTGRLPRPLFWSALVVPLLSACERVVDVEIDAGPVRLVVEGRLELAQSGTSDSQRIKLSTTDAFGSGRQPPAAIGAVVQVSDDHGTTYPFVAAPDRPGEYLAAFVPAIGRRYTLRIDFQGDRYEATDVLQSVPRIDSLYFVYERANLAAGEDGFRAAIDYTDPAGRRNYYLWEQFVDGQSSLLPDPGNRFRVVRSDDFYDGARIRGYQPFDEAVIAPGQGVLVRQIALSDASYRYYFALFEQATGSQGSPFSVPPATVRGNVANLTRPALYPLGYFVAAEVAEARAVLPRDARPPP